MATISTDIIPEILCRFGVKDLLCFRCVSKSWCSLIDSPDFIKLHISQSLKTNTHLSLVFLDKDYDLFSVEFDSLESAQKLNHPFSDEGNCTEILGSCNGLLALSKDRKEIALWNPSTRNSQMLPVAEIEFPGYICNSHYIVYGLGHDPISDDYKLVRITSFYSQEDYFFIAPVMVYSLRTNAWRRIKDFPFPTQYKRAHGVLANNALHWAVSENPKPDAKSFVVAFDLGTEEYCIVELPDCLDRVFHILVKSMGGYLCLTANNWEDHVVDVWMTEKYQGKESWTKLVSVNQSMFNPPSDSVLPLAFSKNGELVLLNINPDTFVWYDLRSETFKKVMIEGVPNVLDATMLVESLVPLNGNGATINKKDHKKKEDGKGKQKKKRDDFLSEGFHLVL